MAYGKFLVDCLIPAAGFSSRMGEWKVQLLIHQGTSLLDTVISRAQKVCDKVIVIGGYRHKELRKLLQDRDGIVLLENPDYEKGMLSSIQKGLEAVERDFFITPADMPEIREEHYRQLFRHFDGNHIVRPVFKGTPGHPILCPLRCKEDILALKAERLLSAFRHWEQVSIEWEDDSVLLDIDTPEDFSNWLSKNGKNNR